MSEVKVNYNTVYAWANSDGQGQDLPMGADRNARWTCQVCGSQWNLFLVSEQQAQQQLAQQPDQRPTQDIAIHNGGQTAWNVPHTCGCGVTGKSSWRIS